MVTKATRDVLDVRTRAITDGIVIDGNCSGNFMVNGTSIGLTTPCEGTFTILTATDLTATGIITATGATLVGFPFLNLAGGSMAGDLDMGSNQINDVTDQTLAQDAATKNYVDTEIAAIAIPSVGPTFITPQTVVSTAAAVGFTLFDASPFIPPTATAVILDYTGSHSITTPTVSAINIRETGTVDAYTLVQTNKNIGGGTQSVGGQGIFPCNGSQQFDYQITTAWSGGLVTVRLVGYF